MSGDSGGMKRVTTTIGRRQASAAEVLGGHQGAGLHRSAQEQWLSGSAPDREAYGLPIEVQLRTIGQDVWANQVEESGRQLGLDLKFGAGDEHIDSIFVAMGELIARFDRAELSPDELREGLRSLPSLTIRTPPPP
jgi:hypothetical protein